MNEKFVHTAYKGNVKIAVCYGESYKAGMSSLAYQKLIELFLSEDFFMSRFFFEKNTVYSPDNFFKLNQANIIVFTISFEPDVINALKMLLLSNVELENARRKQTLICGGILPTLNPKLLETVFDFQYFGEIEGNENKIRQILKIKSKTEILDSLNSAFGKNIQKAEEKAPPPHSVILSSDTIFNDAFLVEISRGCKFNCPFCLIGSYYPDFRQWPFETLCNIIDTGLKYSSKIGLVSALPNSHSDILKIVEYILKKGGKPSFSSIRLELITEEFIKILKSSGQNTLTIAPETADIEVRKKIGKVYTDEKIINILNLSLKHGIHNFKLYFMAGLPGDINAENEIIKLCKKIREQLLIYAKKTGIMPGLSLDISLFVPKPGTKWENEIMQNEVFYKNFINNINKNLAPLGIKTKKDNYNISISQYVLSRIDSKYLKEIITLLKDNKPIKRKLKLIFKEIKNTL